MRKILGSFVCATLALTATAVSFAACDDATSGNQAINYTVKVQSIIGAPVGNVTVDAYDGEVKVDSATTNASGEAVFKLRPDNYDIVVTNIPKGYAKDFEAQYRTDKKGSTVPITLDIEIIQEAFPENFTYQKGDVMYDFTLKDIDGATHNLIDILEEKKAVLLNFFYDGCGPCATEFPYLQTAYEEYGDEVAFLSVSVHTSDTNRSLKSYREDDFPTPLTIPMVNGNEGANIWSAFTNYSENPNLRGSVPATFIIDRFGVMVWGEVGAFEDATEIRGLLSTYVADNYVPETDFGSGSGGTDGGEDGDGSTGSQMPKPENVTMPTSAQLGAAANGENFTVEYKAADASITGDYEYAWPWIVSEDGNSIQPSNSASLPSNSTIDLDYSFAVVYFKVSLKKGQILAFDYKASCEYDCDILSVKVDDTIVHQLSGPKSRTDSFGNTEYLEDEQWKTCYAFAPDPQTASETTAQEYTVVLIYNKDYADDIMDDTVYVNNLRVIDYEDGDTLLTPDEKETGTNILRHAASLPVGGDALPRYEHYVDIVYNEADEYYHVGAADGPLLLANIQYGSYWNINYSVYQLAYNGYCVFDGFDYGSIFDNYAWLCVNSDVGYTPVTKELKYLLELVTEKSAFGKGGYDEDGKTGTEKDNIEWLELCVYYDHYGTSDAMANPILGISFQSAIPVTMRDANNQLQDTATFTVNVEKSGLIPRGYRYEFIPEKSGVYYVRSLATKTDTIGWIYDHKEALVAECDENFTIGDGNFYFTEYLKAGETYYIVCAYNDIYGVGSFNVGIDYLGEQLDHFTNAALGPYTFSETTGQIYVPDAIEVALDGDGYYRAVREDGSLGSYIYLDVFNSTPFLPGQTIYNIVLNGTKHEGEGFDFSYDRRENGTFYPNYTRDMLGYLNEAYQMEGELYGYVKVDEKLRNILEVFTIKYGFAEAYETAWQLLCYYHKHLGPMEADHDCNPAPTAAENN